MSISLSVVKIIRQIRSFNVIILATLLTSFMLLPNLAFAGAGANIYACIYLDNVSTPQQFDFTVKGIQCMSSIGKNVTLVVKEAGVSCTPVGYVEQKDYDTGNDDCYAVNNGLWLLSYHGGFNGSASGSTQTSWYNYLVGSNHLRLTEISSSTNVCYTSDKCTSTSVEWDRGTEPNMYIIFQPAAPSATKLKANKISKKISDKTHNNSSKN